MPAHYRLDLGPRMQVLSNLVRYEAGRQSDNGTINDEVYSQTKCLRRTTVKIVWLPGMHQPIYELSNPKCTVRSMMPVLEKQPVKFSISPKYFYCPFTNQDQYPIGTKYPRNIKHQLSSII